jgi:hypothetical protein
MITISDTVQFYPLHLLREHHLNDVYHSDLDPSARAMLLQDIKENGVRHPLLVREDNTILSGSKRRQLCLELGYETIPGRIVTCSDEEAEYLLVAENKARRGTEHDLIKVAKQLKLLCVHWDIKPGRKSVHDAHDKTRHDVAEYLGMSDSNARRYMQLLDLSEPLQELVSREKIKLKGGVKLSRQTTEVQEGFYSYVEANGFPEMTNQTVYKVIALLTGAEVDDTKEANDETTSEADGKELQKLQKGVSAITSRNHDQFTLEKAMQILKHGLQAIEQKILINKGV